MCAHTHVCKSSVCICVCGKGGGWGCVCGCEYKRYHHYSATIPTPLCSNAEQDLLFKEFMAVCQPSHYMNLATFTSYMTNLKGARPQNVEGFFRSGRLLFQTCTVVVHRQSILDAKEW